MSERRTLLMYATSHIPLADSELLDKHAEEAADIPEWPASNTCFVAGHDYGWILYVGTEGVAHDADAEFAGAGFSPAIPAILRHAHARGAEYVMLDCDAFEDDDLHTFDWQDEQRARDVGPHPATPVSIGASPCRGDAQ